MSAVAIAQDDTSIIRKYGQRSGYNLIGVFDVALPVYRLWVRANFLAKKPIPPIEEFVLRSVEAGLCDPADIILFLGIDDAVMKEAVSQLFRTDDLFFTGSAGSHKHQLGLTTKGRLTVQKLQLVTPESASVAIGFDGLTRQPLLLSDGDLVKPKVAKDLGIIEIPSSSAKAPDLECLELSVVDELVQEMASARGGKEARRELIALQRLERRERLCRLATGLLFKSKEGEDYRLGFLVDRRLSTEHEEAFALSGGLQKLLMRYGIDKETAEERVLNEMGIDTKEAPTLDIAEILPVEEEVQLAVEATEATDDSPEVRNSSTSRTPTVLHHRVLEVYECAEVFRKFISKSRERLLIISPWIRAAVVDRILIQDLETLVRRGVEVYIGYGISEGGDDKAGPHDQRAEQDLLALGKRYPGKFFIRNLGNTHAKVLISDDSYVSASFNWLSFKGSTKRKFRDERGVLIVHRKTADEQFEKERKTIVE